MHSSPDQSSPFHIEDLETGSEAKDLSLAIMSECGNPCGGDGSGPLQQKANPLYNRCQFHTFPTRDVFQVAMLCLCVRQQSKVTSLPVEMTAVQPDFDVP